MAPETLLNSPEARQAILRVRATSGAPLVLGTLAEEFGVSVDTIRRDLLALEAAGMVQRVRGGALPVMPVSDPMSTRIRTPSPAAERIAAAALGLIEDGMVLMLDGGTTVAKLAATLPPLPRSLVVTPAPVVATATLAAGIETLLIGGRLSAFGGIAVGQGTCEAISNVSVDVCFLGACGLDAAFGLSADDLDEAAVRRAMHGASRKTAVLTGEPKLGRRARHRVLPCDALDVLVTDAGGAKTAPLAETGLEIRHA
ncbi:DeoR/GlpR family DNA-binding transcription regulator [Tropicimonas marinistellae]|uniref:DeoR/GlpR family DNA-binding transcription regulator n=1 Tax=Tropicimonas marinistellae TaxID=1739787 RepID=UPI00082A1196|nr:DeoR/GlpR family DNA-binding transcription regulator [Tropicimonas marinistellae]